MWNQSYLESICFFWILCLIFWSIYLWIWNKNENMDHFVDTKNTCHIPSLKCKYSSPVLFLYTIRPLMKLRRFSNVPILDRSWDPSSELRTKSSSEQALIPVKHLYFKWLRYKIQRHLIFQSAIYQNSSIPMVLPTQSRDAVTSTFQSSSVLYFQPFRQTWLDEDSSLQLLYSRKTVSPSVVLEI